MEVISGCWDQLGELAGRWSEYLWCLGFGLALVVSMHMAN